MRGGRTTETADVGKGRRGRNMQTRRRLQKEEDYYRRKKRKKWTKQEKDKWEGRLTDARVEKKRKR